MMNVWGMTDIGLVRRENQDAYAVHVSEETGFTICVVCDGMGGPGGGKLASRLAVDAFLSACKGNLRKGMDWEQVREVTAFAVAEANTAIYERSCAGNGLRGMGTTLVSAVVREGEALLDNVGDSRAYLAHGGGISRITRDHSVVERLIEQGSITEEEARRHPNRNIITRALGPDREALSDSYRVSLEPGDCLLLCTDGLTGTVTDQELADEILRGTEDNQCLDRLLELAKGQGAPDNVTAVLLRRQ
ncbi:MAG: Stp1/IreP family PP2C-type Ser/Thr phosphatase [Oscillospiraceae bacterium]|nr:Stp1/IreP family PP2C-type Ser/Thr phosphatase [Oscillospiraceae bacterium]